MKHLLTLIGLLVLTIGKAQLSFAPATNYGVGSSPSSLISADFDGDGKVDLAVANSFFSNVSILLGSGTGTFATAINYGVGTKPYSVISADFNGDGKVDLATANYTSNDVSILLGSGTGTFVASVNYGVGTNPMSIFSADFNGDGKADLAVTNYNSNNVSILLGSGTGTFAAAVNYAVGTNPSSVLSSDFNGDGKLDLAVTNNYGGNASILLGSGSGAFAASINYWSGGNPGYIISGDLNGDGIADLAMSNFGQNNVSVLLGSGIGTFAGNINFGTGNGPGSIISADFNGDSKVDLATVNISGNDVSILLNTTPIMAAALDFDGVNDIVNIGSTTSINNMGLGGFSLESWLYPHTASGAQSIIRKSGDYNLYINNGYLTAEIWYLGTGNPNLITITGTSTITLNAWSHVACTWDGSIGRLYIDGLEISTSLSANTITTSEVLSLGASSVYGNYLNGNLDEVRIWNIARTQCEINTYKNCEISTIANGLVANYHFNQGYDSGNNTTTTTLVDVSGSANTGTLTNFALTTGTISNWVAPGGVVSGYTISANLVPTISAIVTNPIICNGSSTTLNASGADTYTWTGGVTNATAFTPTVTTSYTVTGTNTITGCSNTSINTVTVNSLPILSISSTNSVCINSSATINVNGALTYTWNTGLTTNSITETPTVTTIYSVTGTDINNCSNTQTVSITVDNTCQDVWPGDANSDGLADNLDVLELGLHYTQTGTSRATTSNLWQNYYSANWSGAITNGKNVNHSNCNGDGTINDDDTLAIFNNYNLTHAFKPAQTTTNPALSIVADQSAVAKATWGTASIYLGDASTAINTINGVAFTVNYDNTLLETDSVWIEHLASFINASNQNLKFRKRDFSNGKLYTATTHTINGNVNGYGKIATLHYKIKSALTTDNILNLSISQANQSNASGVITPLTAGSATLMALGTSITTNLNALTNGNYISIHPNPTNGVLTINSTTELQKIDVMAITGQLLMSEVPLSTSHLLHLDHLSNGVYFVNLYQNNRIVKREKIILNK